MVGVDTGEQSDQHHVMVARIHVRSHLANLPRPHFTLHGGFVGNPPNWHLFWFEFKDF